MDHDENPALDQTNLQRDDSLPLPLDDRTESAPVSHLDPPPLLSANDLLGEVLADIDARCKTRQGGGWTGGMRCGFSLIDSGLRGFRPRSLVILTAEPNVGKTTLANQLAYQVSAFPGQAAATLYVSFENDPTELVIKHLARLSGWRIQDLLDGEVDPGDAKLQGAVRRLSDSRLHYLRGNAATSPEWIQEKAQELRYAGGDLLICLDYLQYFGRFAGAKNQYDSIAIVLPELRRIAELTGACILAISSQNRQTNQSGGPSMYGARGSGELEYDADALFALTRDKKRESARQNCEALTLTAVKSRFGKAGGACDLDFNTGLAHFEEWHS